MQTGKWMAGFALGVFSVVGCEDTSYQEYTKAPLNELQKHDHAHDHGAEAGVHGGHILEIDDAHAHHAEMVFDTSTRDVTLYFYGGEIGVAKAASELTFEIEQDGKEVVLESKPSPLDGETEATCSRYVVAGTQFPESIKSEEQLDGHFHVTIDGKEFTGNFHAHSHDEAAHDDAAHDDHAKDDAAHADEKAPPAETPAPKSP